jgi:iron only hydrogenase large subunit-like protein
MLITLQSHLEVQNYITSQDTRTGILTISPQTLASLVASYTETPSPSSASSSSTISSPLTMTRLLRRIRSFFTSEENGSWTGVWDTTFARHLSLLEHVEEYKERRAVGKGKPGVIHIPVGEMSPLKGGGLPMLASACPGWVCYAEKAHGDLLDFVSHTRSSQGVMGALIKQWWAGQRDMT